MKPSGWPNKPWWPSSMLLRGESIIASSGLILAAILLAVMGCTSYWNFHANRSAMEAARTKEIQAISSVLTETTASLLSATELSAVRRLLVDAARSFDLERCRIILGDGQVIADASPSRITVARLPASWPGSAGVESMDVASDGLLSLSNPMEILGRGNAKLDITANVKTSVIHFWRAQAGIGLIGALALVALLLVYRRMRAQLGTMGLIREALLAHDDSGAEQSTLAVQGTNRAEVEAWNKLVGNKQDLQEQVVDRQLKELLNTPLKKDGELGQAMDEMWYGLLLVDGDLNITYANGAAAAFLASSHTALCGVGLGDLGLDARVEDSVKTVVSANAGTRASVEVDARGEQESGQSDGAVLRFTMRALRREDKNAAIIVIEDISQQRVADESRSAFVTQVTHELRAPLTNIRLCAESAIEDGQANPEVREKCLNVINQETHRLERVVSDMLSVAEIEAGSIQLRKDDVRLDVLLEAMQADCAAQAKEKHTVLKLNLPPKLPVMKGDRDKLTLALHNILINAIKYTPDGGCVTTNVEFQDDEFTVDIIDNGIGISEDDMAHIFERFSRAKDPRVSEITGSGLGLSLAREIVRLHGGDIHVESQLDKGSTFSVRLPVHAKAA